MFKSLISTSIILLLGCKQPTVAANPAILISDIFNANPDSLPSAWLVKACTTKEVDDWIESVPKHSPPNPVEVDWSNQKTKMQANDEVWSWSSRHWDSKRKPIDELGLEGFCILRSGKAIFVITTYGNFSPELAPLFKKGFP